MRRALVLIFALAACDKPVPGAAPAASASAPTASVGAPPSAAPSASAAVAETQAPADWNVLLISIDSLRADMPWAGYDRPIAPALTALEAKSVSYTHAYALSSYTSQSVGGFLVGEYPGAVKRDGFFFGTYPKDVLTFPERLQAAGIHTAAAMAHGYFKHGTGLDQGFDTWKLVPNLKWNQAMDVNVTGPEHEALAEQILGDENVTKGRFFAWFHFMDPHDMYKPHADGTKFGTGKPRDLYDGEVEFADKAIGKLLAFVEKAEWGKRTVVIVTADHGEAFGEHGFYRHGFELYQPLVRVPWFFSIPGGKGKHIDVARSHLDLAPTILDLFHVPADPPFRGVSLVPEIVGSAEPLPRDVVVDLARTSDNDRRRALISGKYKIIANGDDAFFNVFDLDADPTEANDLVKTDKETARAQIEKYKAMRASISDVKPTACRKLKGAPEGRDF